MLILTLSVGLLFLILGAELLIMGATRLAVALGISPLIIGLTVVAFGTSSPELTVSIKSAISGSGDIAVGNVIGSNIFNVLFILGFSAIILPLSVSSSLIKIDVPLMVAVSVLMYLFGMDSKFTRIEGAWLCLALIGYVWFLILQGKKESQNIENQNIKEASLNQQLGAMHRLQYISLVVIGLVLLIVGSRWFVNSAVSIAEYLKINELIIGITIVAVGTSLPEVFTSVIAAIHGERDLAVGNVIGSNLFNIMGVLGITSLISPLAIQISAEAIRFDIPIMIAAALACLPIFFTGLSISRWEGAFLLGYYFVYICYLILAALSHSILPSFSIAVIYFVIPITGIALIFSVVQVKFKK